METFANITRADYDFDDEAYDAVSQDAKDFITGLLVHRKEDRMTADECLNSKWLSLQDDDNRQSRKICTDKLKKFIIRRKWQVRFGSLKRNHVRGRCCVLELNPIIALTVCNLMCCLIPLRKLEMRLGRWGVWPASRQILEGTHRPATAVRGHLSPPDSIRSVS